jgi:hypothetical protein
MHGKDEEIGLWVESPSGNRWKAFGDSRLPGKDLTHKATSTNLDRCYRALQQSVQEVHDAYSSKRVIPPSQFAAWQHAPVIEKISSNTNNLNPLV